MFNLFTTKYALCVTLFVDVGRINSGILFPSVMVQVSSNVWFSSEA